MAIELEKWSTDNHVQLNLDKSKILCIKRNHAVQFGVNDQIQILYRQKDLRIIISRNLIWSENCERRISEACRVFFKKRSKPSKDMTLTKTEWFYRLHSSSPHKCFSNMVSNRKSSPTPREKT